MTIDQRLPELKLGPTHHSKKSSILNRQFPRDQYQ
jgi:hypothetical protein